MRFLKLLLTVPTSTVLIAPFQIHLTDYEYSDASSSDFTFEYDDDSDSDSRGLDFDSLPVSNARPNGKNNKIKIYDMHKQFSVLTVNYKYPCVVCHGPCRNNTQDSISCSVCDEWTHQKCSNLTIQQFQEYCKPENSEMRFYCDNCLFGSIVNTENQTSLNAAEIGLLDTNDIYNLSPNSIFRDMEDVITTEYFTTDELNVEIKKTPDNIRLIHI